MVASSWGLFVALTSERSSWLVDRKSVDGLTALMMASWWGYAAVVHLLLRHPDTDINAQNECLWNRASGPPV
eukprot:1158830-Pelagomonas_calceolata.AAC.8